MSLKENCQFYAGFGDVVARMHPPSHDIVAYRPAKARTNDEDEAYTGELRNAETFLAWAQEKCNPLVREITFENAEELTEEGLPFLILFHHPDDTQSVKDYNDLVKRELMGEKSQVTPPPAPPRQVQGRPSIDCHRQLQTYVPLPQVLRHEDPWQGEAIPWQALLRTA